MKKVFGAILFFSFALILSGCSGKQATNENGVQDAAKEAVNDLKVNSNEVAPKGSREECINGCVMLWKANKDNAAKTEDEMNQYCNQLCDAGQGMKNSDPELCAKGEGAYKDTCYLTVARDTVDSSLCEKIENERFRSGCYRDIVAKNKDKSLCEKITVSYIKDSCLKN